MAYYYVLTVTRSFSFLLERRLSMEGVRCEITFMPRELMTDLCNMGVRFPENEFPKAMTVIRRSAIPGCRVFREDINQDGSVYCEVPL